MADISSDSGNSLATTAQNTGSDAVTNFDPNAIKSDVTNNFDSLNTAQTNTTNDFLKQYQATIAAQPSLSDMYAKYGAANNLPALGQQSTQLNNAVLQVPQQNLDLAKGFNYGQAQVDQKTNQDLTKLQPLASAATNAFQNAQNLTNQQVGYQQTQNQYELQPIQAQQQMLTDQYARQMTGFTTEAQTELAALTAKMQSGVALSQTEMDRADTLATAQASYQNALTTANTQVLGPGQSLVNGQNSSGNQTLVSNSGTTPQLTAFLKNLGLS